MKVKYILDCSLLRPWILLGFWHKGNIGYLYLHYGSRSMTNVVALTMIVPWQSHQWWSEVACFLVIFNSLNQI